MCHANSKENDMNTVMRTYWYRKFHLKKGQKKRKHDLSESLVTATRAF